MWLIRQSEQRNCGGRSSGEIIMTRLIQGEDERLTGRRSQWRLRAPCKCTICCVLSLSLINYKQRLGYRLKICYFSFSVFCNEAGPAIQSKLFSVSLRIPQRMTILAVVMHAQSDYFNAVLEITDKEKRKEKKTLVPVL